MITATMLVLGVLLASIVYWLLAPSPQPLFGVYQQQNRWYWLKRAAFAVMFWLRARKKKGMFSQSESTGRKEEGRPVDRGLGHTMDPFDMECCQPLLQHPYAMDSVYIGAYSEGSGHNFALRVARRSGRQAEIWLLMHVPGVGYLQHPVHPDTSIFNTDPNSFTAGGLRFDVVHPMQRWRVSYSGQLRVGPCNSLESKPDKFLDVRFTFQWDAFAPHFNYDSDLDPSLLGDAIARETWTKEYFERLHQNHQTHYEQWGELKGTMSIEGHETQQLRLKAIRDHSFGVRRWTDFYRYIYCFLYIENGTTLQIGAVSQPGMLSHLKTGCLTYPTGEIATVTSLNLNLWEVGETEQQPPSQWTLNFIADGISYELKVTAKQAGLLYHEADRGGIVHETFCDVTLNGRKGWGLSELFYRNQVKSEVKAPPVVELLTEPPLEQVANEELCLSLTSLACCSSAVVGGKGSQLALLTRMSEKENISVPSGLCVTLRAFDRQIQENENLKHMIDRVADTAVNSPADLVGECERAVSHISQKSVFSDLQTAVVHQLRHEFGEDFVSKRFAIRSSAAGEDGNEASSAGQMETYLGIRGKAEIFSAMQKCWASAYSFPAVEYRRQHGQPVLTSVGVVIQEMVPAETSGVLFTADPVDNNVSKMLINSNYGLGESVVSGKSDPDTIVVHRSWDDSLSILSRHIGRKQTKITMQDGGGVAETKQALADSSHCCLSDSVIISLATIGMQTEKYFGSPRDIEWAYTEGQFFLLQARPITTSEQESEEELVHEFDNPLSGGYEWLTTGNIGEMMPGAVTPLTMSCFAQAVEYSLQQCSKDEGGRSQVVAVPKAIASCGNHLFINLSDLMLIFHRIYITKKDIMEINLLGETRPDLKLEVSLDYMGKPPPATLLRIINSVRMLLLLRRGNGKTKEWEKRMENYILGKGCSTAEELYEDINLNMSDLFQVWRWTLVNSAYSGSMSTALISTITRGSTVWTSEHYGDVALLLSQCQNVYSAEVPSAMQNLAQQICRDELKEKFLSSSDQECFELLTSPNFPELKKNTEMFMHRHGHRCVREAEMRELSWHLDPSKLTSAIKTVLRGIAHQKVNREIKSAKELISQLKTPLPWITRKILEFLVPKSWSAVAKREWGKSLAIKMNDHFKTAYWKLAALMVREGRLPDKDLLFFLTHYEIGVLLKTRSARLVMKAQRRRKVLPKQMDLRFSKINFGHPKPIEVTQMPVGGLGDAKAVLRGMPVGQGVVRGPARIVLNVADAHLIQAGDILVVTCTDIGWCPYFPLIAGLVTEIGGLISHGAVVAREYGIPCIVNVPDATILLQNGCQVELDGRAGSIKMLD